MLKEINVAYCFDKNLWRQMGVSVASLLSMSGADFKYNIFAVVSADVDDAMKGQLRDIVKYCNPNAEIKFYTVNDDFYNPKLNHAQGYYYRLQIPNLIRDIDRIVYVDIDTVFNSDLFELYSMDMGDKLVFGVKDGLNLNHAWKKYQTKTDKKYIVQQGDYINSGVLLMNLKLMREEGVYKSLVSLVGERLRYKDQDMLNYVCRGRVGYLPLKYNFTPKAGHKYARMVREGIFTKSEVMDAVAHSVIMHFVNCNPWNKITKCCNRWWYFSEFTPFYKQFRREFFARAGIMQKVKFLIMPRWRRKYE